MRKKELRLVVTFHTTADAMAMEKACKEHEVNGRLIPVPTAGCGLAWCAEPEERDAVIGIMDRIGIEHEELHDCMV